MITILAMGIGFVFGVFATIIVMMLIADRDEDNRR